jgi:hypothetical protein
MALNFVQMPGIQWDRDVQMCQPAKWSQLGENAAETHLNIKITDQMEFIKERGTTVEDGFQWGQLNKLVNYMRYSGIIFDFFLYNFFSQISYSYFLLTMA